eukprot:1577824-Rhodomonas_salina.2
MRTSLRDTRVRMLDAVLHTMGVKRGLTDRVHEHPHPIHPHALGLVPVQWIDAPIPQQGARAIAATPADAM